MSELRNRVDQLVVVVPFDGAADDIKAHGGKIVKPVRYGASGLGGNSWTTDPVLFDGFGNAIGWDDLDLKPLGDGATLEPTTTAVAA